ncbi:hypothetical protein IB227_04530 [Stenotrophomonas sp. STM01]|uniref:hypothetical protein n=1 Tax=unclassified Stenotrophomonas TaxID=196198 RepID=UPI0017830A9A|nr:MULTISPECIES: hypothetical protein [unclassified Stenotrophomonas]MBD9535117.1 hypothetical protein [Stenotrophomonas sp. STM01]
MYQLQRQQDVAIVAHRASAIRPVALCALLLLSLLASLWQHGTHLPRLGGAQSTCATAGEERGETPLEEQGPAKLRRAAPLHAARAALPHPGFLPRRAAVARAVAPLPIPAASHQAPPALHSPRQQRGQAPPLA